MKMQFDSDKIEQGYFDSRKNQKKYNKVFAEELEKMLNFIDNAECAYDVKMYPRYHMHLLHGDYDGIYSLSPDNKKSKWRVPALCINDNNEWWKPDQNNEEITVLKQTKIFNLKEITDYHD